MPDVAISLFFALSCHCEEGNARRGNLFPLPRHIYCHHTTSKYIITLFTQIILNFELRILNLLYLCKIITLF